MADTEGKRLTPEEIDDFTYELIRFCFKWGLWEDTNIFSNGNRYADCLSGEESTDFRGFRVRITKERPEDYIYDVSGGKDYQELYVNPDHILSMIMGERLCMLTDEGLFSAHLSELSEDGVHQLLALDPSILEECLGEIGESPDPILEQMEFESYDEFRELEDDLQDLRLLETIDRLRKWRSVHYRGFDDPVVSHVLEEFDGIFEKYGVWYDPGYRWSLTCYYHWMKGPSIRVGGGLDKPIIVYE